MGGSALAEDFADLLGAVVGNFDSDVCLIGGEGRLESFLLTWGELIARGRQNIADGVEGIALALAVAQGVLLDAARQLSCCFADELEDLEGIEHAGGMLELVIDGFLVPWKGASVAICTPEWKFSPRFSSQFR